MSMVESIFSDLNHLKVVTVTSRKYGPVFGFTEREVYESLKEYGLQDRMEEVTLWYDGFQFGDCKHIYNPWSIINYLDERRLGIYWANTSSNHLASYLLQKGSVQGKLLLEDLMNGKNICVPMDEEIAFNQLSSDKNAIWSLLFAGGYLKASQVVQNRKGKMEYVLAITNKEIRTIFDQITVGWFTDGEMDYNDFSEALLSVDKVFMNEYMNQIASEVFSCFDTGKRPSGYRQPENFYHGFLLGLIADLRNIYYITSNRESGFGRYDVLLEPLHPEEDDRIIIEFKVHNQTEGERGLTETVHAALLQIIRKGYASVLQGKDIPVDKIRIYGFAFSGEKVLVDGGYASDYMEME